MWKSHTISCEKCLSENNLDSDQKTYDTMFTELKENKFAIENVCFSGGGMRCIGYVGAIYVLDELKVLSKIKRFAGTSGGAIIALLCALGYTSDELFAFASQAQTKYLDRKCGWISWLYYLFNKNYGVYQGKVLENDIKKMVQDKFDRDFPGNKIINPTFKDLYEKYNKELIIVATNLSKLSSVYFSPKNTPDMPLYLAVRMSASIPGCFESVVYNNDRYVDGGLCENYPLDIFCYGDKYIYSEITESPYLKTIGFTLLSNGVKIIKEYKRYEIENQKSHHINTSYDFAYSIIDFVCTQNFEDEMSIINSFYPNSFLNHTVIGYTPCITTADFNASLDNKLDTIAIFKYLTISFMRNWIIKIETIEEKN